MSHDLLFCEPYTADLRRPRGVKFKVSDAFYQVLLKAPRKYKHLKGRVNGCNAYVFGPKYPLDSYVFLGEHGNDGAQTGIIDLNLLRAYRKRGTDIADISETVLKHFRVTKHHMKDWDDRRALAQVRKELPFILFLGETFGGDVGAALYGHFNKNKKLNSIIIDVFCFYP